MTDAERTSVRLTDPSAACFATKARHLNQESNIFATTPPTQLFLRCAIPAAVTSAFGALYSVADGIFVGRFIGENALAAVNLMMPVILIVEALSNMVATGASVNISLLLGRGDRENASRFFSFAVKLIIAFSCLVGVLGILFARQFVTLMAPGASDEAVSLAADYLTVYSAFAPLVPMYFATDNFLRVCGKQRFSMIVGVATQVANVIMDFVLIVILHQGVMAAALSSCVAISAGSVVTLLAFRGKRLDVYYTGGRLPARQLGRILANGSSEFLSNIATSVMGMVMNLFLLRYGGTQAVAAFAIVMYVDSVIGMLAFGVCDALQPALSFCYGANMLDRMRAIFRRVLVATVAIAIASFLFMLLVGPYAATIFVKPGDDALLQMSVVAVQLFSFSYLVGWIDLCFSSYFTALDRPVRSLVVSLFGTLVLPIVLLVLLTSQFGLNGVWLSATAAAVASGLLTLILAKTMRLDAGAQAAAKVATSSTGDGFG